MAEIYLAGKVDAHEGEIENFAIELEQRGHMITFKWWLAEALPKPYLAHPATSESAAKMMVDAVKQSDIFILFAHARLLGASKEFGVALGHEKDPKREIIVVGDFIHSCRQGDRQSVFYAHPDVIALSGLDVVRKRDWY